MLGKISRFMLIHLTRKFYLGEVKGIDHLPEKGPFIITANHSSFFDHFIIAAICKMYRDRRVYYLTKKESFDNFFSRVWHLSVGCIPIDRKSADIKAFRTVLRYLSEEKIVCIYPEGTRSFTGKMLEGKAGAIKFAMMSNVPVVPIGIIGAFDILPKGKKIPRFFKAKVEIGEAISFPREASKKENVQKYSNMLMSKIKELVHVADDFDNEVEFKENRSPTRAEMIEDAKDWNEIGIRQSWIDAEKSWQLHFRAAYLCQQVIKYERNPSAHFELGRAYGRMALGSGVTQKIIFALKAKKHFHRSVKIDSEQAHPHYALGLWHASMPFWIGGSSRQALKEYQLGIQHAPDEIFIYMGLAKYQYQIGFIEEAKMNWIKVLNFPIKHAEDRRRKLEALTQLLRVEPKFNIERRYLEQCLAV